jgi:adenosylcobinamide-GDP ribazoletransferase
MHLLRLLATALTFLTRLPWVARFAYPDSASLAHSAALWPWIGGALGLFAAACYHATAHFLAPSIAAVFGIASVAIITGGFHEDGLADSADGLFGGYTVEKRLEIMKDSRIGTFGALALIFNCALLFTALSSISAAAVMPALVLGHCLGRASSLPLACTMPYARFAGNNKPIAENMGVSVSLSGLLSSALLACALWYFAPLASSAIRAAIVTSVIGACLLWPLAGWLSYRKLGGVTGDTLGAINQLTLTWCLLCFAAYSPAVRAVA